MPSLPRSPLPFATVADAGGKGRGLLRLPPDWYPPTVVISAEEGSEDDDARFDEQLARALVALGSDRVLVRSSAHGEDLRNRGQYESEEVTGNVANVTSAIARIRAAAGSVPMAILVQPALHALIHGHLSNEHRLSREKHRWILQYISREEDGTEELAVRATVAAKDDEPLAARNTESLKTRLREVARYLANGDVRHHLEWLWDGRRVWIVQADDETVIATPPPGELFTPRRGRPLPSVALTHFRSATPLSAFADWPKLQCVAAFDAAGLPLWPLSILDNPDVLSALSSGRVPAGLSEDVHRLVEGDILIRSDTKNPTAKHLLPRTMTESDADLVVRFLIHQATEFVASGLRPDSFCFIAHRYLRARACAWTRAAPGDARVLIDTTYGLADGLSWLPHDSWRVSSDDTITRRIRAKTSLLDVQPDGSFAYRDTPTDLIWAESARQDQLLRIADGARELARDAGRAVLTMWFLDVLDAGDIPVLPWFQTYEDDDAGRPTADAGRGRRRSVRNLKDIEAARTAADAGDRFLVRLEPDQDCVRDTALIQAVATLAADHGLDVELVGSPLAHSYYELRRAGATVVCPDLTPEPQEAPRQRFGKLVRDLIPDRIAAMGERVVTYQAPEGDLVAWLRTKLVEEAHELRAAGTRDEQVAELADVHEVVESLLDELGLDRDGLEEIARVKRAERGGLSGGRVLVETGVASDGDRQQPLFDTPGGRGDAGVVHTYVPPVSRGVIATGPSILRIAYAQSPTDPGEYWVTLAGIPIFISYADTAIVIRAENNDQLGLFDNL
jgi:predicted house-cleaning noncanonical NTP pyrophosphatase (MazG superfamily)